MDQDREPGAQLPEEPQSERGAMGSRDEGGPPGAGPADRPAGTSDAGDLTGVDPQESGASPGGGRSAGRAPSLGGDTGGAVPPYEGRREGADIAEGGADRDDAHVGGATGPRVSSRAADDPGSTPLGRSASPADGEEGTEPAAGPPDPGVGPAHQGGVRRGEDTPE